MVANPSSHTKAVDALTAEGAPFELVEREVNGLPMRLYANLPTTMPALLSHAHDEFAQRFCVVSQFQRWTYDDVYRTAAGLGHWLRDTAGLNQGDRVGISMRNLAEWAPIFWGVLAAGMVAVPLNAWWTRDEFTYGVNDSGATLLFVDSERARVVDGLADLVVIGETESSSHRRWQDVLDSLDMDAPLPDVAVAPEDLATILYTSGTTGKPKGSMSSHLSHCTNAGNGVLHGLANSMARNGGVMPAPAGTEGMPLPSSFLGFPIFHTAGLSGLYTATLAGAKIGLLNKWDAQAAFDLVESEELTGFSGVPTMVAQLVNEVKRRGHRPATLQSVGSGGAPTTPDQVRTTNATFEGAVTPINGYGLTETTSGVCFAVDDDYLAQPDSVGRVVPTGAVKVIDSEGLSVADGTAGELCFYGPNVFLGYWEKPQATQDVLVDGWFATGDLGFVLEDRVYVLDRIKDMVLRAGENIFSVEVESAIADHPMVTDVAVFGVPHDELGEEVAAVVVAESGLDDATLVDYLTGKIAKFKIPSVWRIAEEPLPRNPTGKVMKRQLRTDFVDG